MKTKHFIILAMAVGAKLQAQGPEVTSWIINTTSATGYGGILSNVQQVQYSTNNVYISATCIPGYAIGPWAGNPNTPSNQNFVYKITRTPQQNTGTAVTTPMGHIGVWTNGVSMFNAKDGMSYNNQGIWNRDAYFFEGSSFDNCLGHPAPNGEYHNHVNPKCLYNENDSLNHSPIIGYAFDGYPVYGAYGYASATTAGAVKRMRSSYSSTTTSTRVNGPTVSSTYPSGCFIEDYVYTAGSGDLDAHNGRFCVTPEYPSGTYAYFVTINGSLNPVYPYVIGPTYYGTVQAGNTGPSGGHNTITETVTTYSPTSSGIKEAKMDISYKLFPNPSSGFVHLFIDAVNQNNFDVVITDISGKEIVHEKNIQPTITYSFDLTSYSKGIYFLKIKNKNIERTEKLMIH